MGGSRLGITANEHWTKKGEDVDLFLFEKTGADTSKGTVLFVHGSSMASTPTFDLQVPGRPWSSAMDWFCDKGFSTWCVDMEGYGRSSKHRDINCDIANGADDLIAATDYITKTRGVEQFMVYGISSGALARGGLRGACAPERVEKLALDAMVWTGKGSPTLEQRKKKLPEFIAVQPAADRSGVRAHHLQPRSSRLRRGKCGRGLR